MQKFCSHFAVTVTESKSAESWFFIRYSDPDPHIRLRISGEPRKLAHEVEPELCRLLGQARERGLVRKFGFESYEREIERYGGPAAISIAEDIFATDSGTIASLPHSSRQRHSRDRQGYSERIYHRHISRCSVRRQEKYAWYKKFAIARAESGPDYRLRKDFLRPLFLKETGSIPEEIFKLLGDWSSVLNSTESIHRVGSSLAAMAIALCDLSKPDSHALQSFPGH